MFKEFSHDFGTVAKNEFAEHRFEIQNKFEEDITISNVRTSCSCTDVSVTKKVLKSKEIGYLVAKFNTRNFVGAKQATVTVYFGAPYNAEVQLTVRGNIRGDVMFEPGVIDFGSITQESFDAPNSKKLIQITKFNNPNWEIVDVKSTFPHVGVSLSNPIRRGNQIKYEMGVRLKDSAPAGLVQDELIIVARDFGRTSNIPVKFSAKIASSLQISPEVLSISATEKGDVIQKNVVVKASKPFRISDVTCTNDCFTVEADPDASKKVHFVKVAYSAKQAPGRYECDLEFITDLNEKTTGKIKAIIDVTAPSTSVDVESTDNE